MITKNTLIVSASLVVALGVIYFAFKNKKNATQEDIATDVELKELITKIDNAPK